MVNSVKTKPVQHEVGTARSEWKRFAGQRGTAPDGVLQHGKNQRTDRQQGHVETTDHDDDYASLPIGMSPFGSDGCDVHAKCHRDQHRGHHTDCHHVPDRDG